MVRQDPCSEILIKPVPETGAEASQHIPTRTYQLTNCTITLLDKMHSFAFIFSLTLTTVLASPLIGVSVRQGSAPFSYDPTSGIGPQDWGNISGFETCGNSTSQSPINIFFDGRNTAPRSEGPQPNLVETEFKFERTTENFEMDCEDEGNCGFTTLNGERFNLVNIHFHSSSEHRLRGRQLPLELHMVHSSESGELLVIGTFFRTIQGRNAENDVFENTLDQIESGETDVTVDVEALIGDGGYIGYSGSLTTPPCTEGVNWFVARTIQSVSPRQVRRYSDITGSRRFGNNRPIERLNGRSLTPFV